MSMRRYLEGGKSNPFFGDRMLICEQYLTSHLNQILLIFYRESDSLTLEVETSMAPKAIKMYSSVHQTSGFAAKGELILTALDSRNR